MSRLTDTLSLNLGFESADLACRQAIAELGWKIKQDQPGRLTLKRRWSLTRNPASIEVLVSARGDVTLTGRIFGVGPLAKNPVRELMTQLRVAIDVAAVEIINRQGRRQG